ncbi:hypothetical protein FHG64_03145 [Antarcticibacterium flavum]|uniref:Uncharacterized protein n=1 Tax=Antarcticibacterium flavum TaxID=2058175 RepID=A0A5B7X1G6_9FLAO|nr:MULTISPECIES: hypothetical protein [Antarcticibacterium]MCM4158602.1 hypothetical protein [Antarcticibacterium sp. W02-3]QCY68463.1 hypothetical protein FHG64_03145 [Antarcticibacterium flavum]
MKNKTFSILILAVFLACDSDDEQPRNDRLTLKYEFEADAEGWTGDFADYPAGEEEAYGLEFKHSPHPEPLDNSQGSLMLTGRNHSDDLFMFVKRQVTGLSPNTEYRLNFEVEFASNVATGQFGIGGSPGESVYLKAGATPAEPQKEEDELGWYRLDIDKGNQATGGRHMVVIGNFANGTDNNIYTLKTLSTSVPLTVTTNSEGSLWLLFGTDSGFEGETTIYMNSIEAELYK